MENEETSPIPPSLLERQEARWEAILAGNPCSDPLSAIEDLLFLGGARDPAWIAEHKIQLVIALGPRDNPYAPLPEGVVEHYIALEDSPLSNIVQHIHVCHALITEAHARGEAVLVHCAAGISRSPTIVIGHLVLKNKWRAISALTYVRQRRLCVAPNWGFWRQLLHLSEDEDRGQ